MLILLLPLLAGTPTPVTVLMDGVGNLTVTGLAAQSWPGFHAGDVLLCSARRPLHAGEWVLFKDVGGPAALRANNASTAVGRLLHFVACGGSGRVAAEACATSLMREGGMTAPPVNRTEQPDVGDTTHAMVLRQKRATVLPRGAVRLGRCPEENSGPGGECALIPVAALLASVQLRIPRIAWPAVPFFRLKRQLLAARPPQPRFAPALAARAQQLGLTDWLLGPAMARRDEAARLAAATARCSQARVVAAEAQGEAKAASFFSRGSAGRAAAAAQKAAEEACAGLE